MVAYKSAYLRAHYPAEFMASVISNGGGYYSTFGYLSEARRMGLMILPPHINQSEIKYTGKDREVRIGLMQIKDLSQEAKDAIIHERDKNGPFVSFKDFLDRLGSHVHLQDVRTMIKAGCFDGIAQGIARPGLMWHALAFFNQNTPTQTLPIKGGGLGGGQLGLFDQAPTPVPLRRAASHKRPYPKDLMLRHESETLGFYLSVHPLDLHHDKLTGVGYVCAKDLHAYVRKMITTIGWLVTGKTIRTKTGEAMKFISFEDTTGLYEAVFFPKIYNRFCHMLNATRPYILKGKVDEDFGSMNMTVNWIGFLDRYQGTGHRVPWRHA